MQEKILILDFGSQFTQLIARRLRELSVYCEILPFHTPPETLAARKPVVAQPSRPSITIETAGVVVRAECGVDVDWLAAVLRAMKALS